MARVTIRAEAERRMAAMPGVRIRPSRWSTLPAVWNHEQEIAHFHGPDSVDVRVGRRNVSALKQRVQRDMLVFRPYTSDWVEVRLRRRSDVEALEDCLRLAVATKS